MQQGLEATGSADQYLLFTDADIAWDPAALRSLVAAAESDDRALVSQMALLRAQTGWERIVVPAFVYFFFQLYPPRRVNDPRSRVAAAAGGCMLIRRSALEKAGGLTPVRGALIDDVAVGTLLKRDGNRTWLGLTTEIRSVRPYPRLADLWQMIARSAYVQLGYSPLMLAGTILGLLFLYAAPPAGMVAGAIAAAYGAGTGAALAGLAGLAGLALMTCSAVPMLRFYRLSVLRAPALPLIAVLYAAMTADSARRHYSGRAVSWRGRPAEKTGLPGGRCLIYRAARFPWQRGQSAADWLLCAWQARVRLAGMRVPELKLWAGEPGSGPEDVREFLIADVFTPTPLEGNQLGIFPDGRGLPAQLMLKATREMNFSETVFFLPPDDPAAADARVRIFTPGGELPFAGHPTLGSAWVLGELLGKDAVTLQLGVGPVPVRLERDPGSGLITFGRMSQPVPQLAGPYPQADELLAALGAAPADGGLPVEVYVNGPVNVYVELADERAVVALAPDMHKLASLPVNVSCFAQTPAGVTTRMFAPALGVTEDPATGSAAGPLALHLARHGRIAFGQEIEIRQGAQVGRPSVLYARADGSAEQVERVLVGGRAVLVARGEYRLG
jgi:PhzF family phenazine biosynthesis protein